MFTSRAEHRLLLSQNNAEQRLLKKAYKLNLVDEKRFKDFLKKEEEYKNFIKNNLIKNKITSFKNKQNKKINLKEKKSVLDLLSRTDADKDSLFKTNKKNKHLYQRAVTENKYKGYIKKQLREINKKHKTK